MLRCAACRTDPGAGRPRAGVPQRLVCLGCPAGGPRVGCPRHAPCPGGGGGSAALDPAHRIWLDLDHLELWCATCEGYVYWRDYDVVLKGSLARSQQGRLAAQGKLKDAAVPKRELLARSRSSPYLAAGRAPPPPRGAPPAGSTLGLRGLNNLGHTCFMNSVVQSLLQIPTLQSYYLGCRHEKGACKKTFGVCMHCELDGVFQEAFSGAQQPFSPASLLHAWWLYSGSQAGYGQQDAHEFLLMLLGGMQAAEAGGLEGANGFQTPHKAASPTVGGVAGQTTPVPKSPWSCSNADDRSIVLRTFGGKIRSDVTCCRCGDTSVKFDPFVDVSLELKKPAEEFIAKYTGPPGKAPKPRPAPAAEAKAETPKKKEHGRAKGGRAPRGGVQPKKPRYPPRCGECHTCKNRYLKKACLAVAAQQAKAKQAAPAAAKKRTASAAAAPRSGAGRRGGGEGDVTLAACLRQYTKKERLQAGNSFFCATCGAYGESFKQISFRKLPPVLCLHVKRFEHFPGAGQARKVTSRLQFPLDYLDVGPYMASSVLAQRYHSHGLEEATGKLRREEGEAASKYKLAAVVSHLGTMAGGHYVVYVRRGAKWFLCNDASIAEVDEAVVRNCEAYLLFYMQLSMNEFAAATAMQDG